MHWNILTLTLTGLKLVYSQLNPEDASEFWLEAKLIEVNWKQNCLTTGGCAEPRFRLTKTNIVTNERISISWRVTEKLVERDSRPFVSHWKGGDPEKVSLDCEVAGIDPLYSFPRTCDASTNVRIFPETKTPTVTELEKHSLNSIETEKQKNGKVLVKLKGKCFNATVEIQKHTVRCPWCLDCNNVALIEHIYAADPSDEFAKKFGTSKEKLFQISLVVLSCIAGFSTIAFAFLLFFFLRQKRSLLIYTDKANFTYKDQYKPIQPEMYGQLKAGDGRLTSTPLSKSGLSGYETPWDQKYRPLPCWIGNRPDPGLLAPAEARPFGISTLPHRTQQTTIIGQRNRLSANSSFNDHHDDSGLESV